MTGATTNRPRSRRLPPDVRREQVLDAAARRLRAGGRRALSVEGVAAEAGVSKTVVYNAFADLDKLILALIAREESYALAALAAAAPELTEDADPSDTLLAWADALSAAVVADPERWRLILFPPPGTPGAVLKRIERGRELVVEQLTGVLGSLAPAGEDWDIELAARAIAAAAEQHARLMVLDRDAYPPERISSFVRTLLDSFTRG